MRKIVIPFCMSLSVLPNLPTFGGPADLQGQERIEPSWVKGAQSDALEIGGTLLQTVDLAREANSNLVEFERMLKLRNFQLSGFRKLEETRERLLKIRSQCAKCTFPEFTAIPSAIKKIDILVAWLGTMTDERYSQDDQESQLTGVQGMIADYVTELHTYRDVYVYVEKFHLTTPHQFQTVKWLHLKQYQSTDSLVWDLLSTLRDGELITELLSTIYGAPEMRLKGVTYNEKVQNALWRFSTLMTRLSPLLERNGVLHRPIPSQIRQILIQMMALEIQVAPLEGFDPATRRSFFKRYDSWRHSRQEKTLENSRLALQAKIFAVFEKIFEKLDGPLSDHFAPTFQEFRSECSQLLEI